MEDSTLFFNSAASTSMTPSELDSNANMTAFPFFTSPPTLSPYQTLERSKISTSPFGSTSAASKVLAESFDAALQALSQSHSTADDIFSTSDSMRKRPGLPMDFKKPASSIGSSAPSSATSDASDALADRLASDFDADSISLGSNSGFDSWSISPSPVLMNNLQLSDVGSEAAARTGTVRSGTMGMAADIFAQYIADDSAADAMDTIRGLPVTTPQRPSIFNDFNPINSASSGSSMSMCSSPATPLDGQPFSNGFLTLQGMGSPRKGGPGPRPQFMERTHSQLETGSFSNLIFGMSPQHSPAFMAFGVEPSQLSCNPAHLGSTPEVGARIKTVDQPPHRHLDAVPLLRLDGALMDLPSASSQPAGQAQQLLSNHGTSVKQTKAASASPQLQNGMWFAPSQIFSSPVVNQEPHAFDGPSVFSQADGSSLSAEDRPAPVRAVPGFVGQTFSSPNLFRPTEMQADRGAAAAAQKCVDQTNRNHTIGSSRAAVLGPAALAACADSSGAIVQPTPIPVKALIGQHSAATLAHGRPVITATVPLPTYSGIITKRSRGRRVPNDPLEMQNLGKGGKIWTCLVPECGKCFRRSEHLKRHIRSIHTEERPYMCPFPGCKKGFSRHDNLNQHARVHQMVEGEGGVAMVPSMSSYSSSDAGSSSSPASSTKSRKRKQPGDLEDEMRGPGMMGDSDEE